MKRNKKFPIADSIYKTVRVHGRLTKEYYCNGCGNNMSIRHPTSTKFCSLKCIETWRRKSGWYRAYHNIKNPERFKRKCIICERNILKVKDKNKKYEMQSMVGKYCCKKCMLLGQRIRNRGQKYCFIKFPISMIKTIARAGKWD